VKAVDMYGNEFSASEEFEVQNAIQILKLFIFYNTFLDFEAGSTETGFFLLKLKNDKPSTSQNFKTL
jgi:hypothetical protein